MLLGSSVIAEPVVYCCRSNEDGGAQNTGKLALIHIHTHLFNSPLSETTRVSQYRKGKTNLDFTEARDSEWQWYQLGHMHVCTSLQTVTLHHNAIRHA